MNLLVQVIKLNGKHQFLRKEIIEVDTGGEIFGPGVNGCTTFVDVAERCKISRFFAPT